MDCRFSLDYSVIACCRCGLAFAVPDSWKQQRIRDSKFWRCPNGHKQRYSPEVEEDEPTPAEVELRRLHIKQLHDEEQAEARAAEGKTDAPIADFDALHCLACDKRYKNAGSFRRHMERTHRVDPCTLKPLQP